MAAAADMVEVLVPQSVTAAENPATSPALAPRTLEVSLEGMAEVAEVAAMAASEVVNKRLGEVRLVTCYNLLTCPIFSFSFSYTCGGVGHLSRDCVQGSKCYNCSGVVCILLLSYRYR